MTISTSDQQVDAKKFDESFDRIFGAKKKSKTASYIQDPDTGELIERSEYVPKVTVNAPMVMNPMQDFVSPIDKTVISTRSQLAAHNKKHGVTNVQDYKNGYIEKRAHERVDKGQRYLKETRRTDIGSAIDRHTR